MLSGLGFKEVYNLKGGMMAWEGLQASGPKELNMDLVRGDESQVEMVRLSYSLENGLQKFYKNMQNRTKDNAIEALFSKLVQIEKSHKKRLVALYRKIEPDGNDVVSLTLNGTSVDFGDASTYYEVSTVNYVAAGSCNFNNDGETIWPLAQITYDSQLYVRDSVINYVDAQVGPIAPAIEGRLVFVP